MARAKVRRIGNSLGVIIPKQEAQRQGLHEGDEVDLSVRKARGLADVWGSMRGKLGRVDALNDLVDEGEEVG